jgi:hypothetical protein
MKEDHIDNEQDENVKNEFNINLKYIYFISAPIIFASCELLMFFGHWQYLKSGSAMGIALQSAGIFGNIHARYINAFMFIWLYRFYAFIRLKLNSSYHKSSDIEIFLLAIGSIFSFSIASDEGNFDTLRLLIQRLIS